VPVTGSHLEEFLAIVRRDLGAEDARILEAGEELPKAELSLTFDLEGGRRLVAIFAEPPSDAEVRLRRLSMLASSFHSVLTPTERTRPSRPPAAHSLHEELTALVQRAGAVDALVIDAHSPVVWGTAGEEREAPSLSPTEGAAEPPRETGALRLVPLVPKSESAELTRLSRQYGLASVEGPWMDPRAVEMVPRALCDKYRIVPLSKSGETLVIGMVDPQSADAIFDLVLVTGLSIDPVITSESMLALFARWNDGHGDTRSYAEVMAAIDPEARPQREVAARVARAAWLRHLASRRAIEQVRALPEMATLRRGGHMHHTVSEPGFGYVARSFAAIYVLLLVFDAPFDELRAKRAIVHSLPGIERAVLALPPLDPGPPMAGVVALRGRGRRRRR
jgi:hypothetical protein